MLDFGASWSMVNDCPGTTTGLVACMTACEPKNRARRRVSSFTRSPAGTNPAPGVLSPAQLGDCTSQALSISAWSCLHVPHAGGVDAVQLDRKTSRARCSSSHHHAPRACLTYRAWKRLFLNGAWGQCIDQKSAKRWKKRCKRVRL